MNENMLEILISKYLDSEITPAEQKLLDEELLRNPLARQLLKDMEQLQELSREFTETQITETGRPAEVIIEKALNQVGSKRRPSRKSSVRPWRQDPISLAACFLLALGIASFWATYLQNPNASKHALPDEQQAAIRLPVESIQAEQSIKPAIPVRRITLPPEVNRTEDWVMYYVDPAGDLYLMEKTPQRSRVETATYTEGL